MIRKHSVSLNGHKTSFTLEDPFWQEITAIAQKRDMTLAALLAEIDEERSVDSNFSSAIRLYVLSWLKQNH